MPSLFSNLIFLVILGYFLGSIPFGYLISKAKGVDIRKIGSGNIGGMNVFRALGLKWAILVVILDAAKGAIPTYLAASFLVFEWQIALVAISPILGHIFSVWLKFKGGKGVATLFGVLFTLLGWRILLIWFGVWLLLLAIFKMTSLVNLLMVSYLPLIFWLSFHSLAYVTFGFIVFILIWWAHRENLRRIAKNEEPKISFGKR